MKPFFYFNQYSKWTLAILSTLCVSLLVILFLPPRFMAQLAESVDTTPTGKENHSITLSEASTMVTKFQSSEKSSVFPLAEYFGRQALTSILDQRDCIGVRIYNAENESGANVFVLVGVDRFGKDMTSGFLAERGFPCPPICDTSGDFFPDGGLKLASIKR